MDRRNLHLAIRAAGVTLWSWNVDTDELTMDEQAFALWGLPHQATVTFEDLSAHIHPKDRDRVRAAFQATRAIVGPSRILPHHARPGDPLDLGAGAGWAAHRLGHVGGDLGRLAGLEIPDLEGAAVRYGQGPLDLERLTAQA